MEGSDESGSPSPPSLIRDFEEGFHVESWRTSTAVPANTSLPRPHEFYAFDSQLLLDPRRADTWVKCRFDAGMPQHRFHSGDAAGLDAPQRRSSHDGWLCGARARRAGRVESPSFESAGLRRGSRAGDAVLPGKSLPAAWR